MYADQPLHLPLFHPLSTHNLSTTFPTVLTRLPLTAPPFIPLKSSLYHHHQGKYYEPD